MSDQRLSDNFTLYEMLANQPATRMGFGEQFDPAPKVIYNLKLLCVHVLQPLRNALGYDLRVSSGYRCPRLNAHIGGSANSQHLQGKAVDLIDVYNGNAYLLKTVLELNLPFDQMIDAHGQAWVHLSYDAFRARQQVLKSYTDEEGKLSLRQLEKVDSGHGLQFQRRAQQLGFPFPFSTSLLRPIAGL